MRNTKVSSLSGDAIKLTTSKILTMVISLLTAMILSRVRSLEEYGTYSQILLVTNIISSIFMLGLPSSINFFLANAESRKERENFLSVYYTFSTILSLIIGLVLVAGAPLIVNYFNNPLLTKYIYVLAVYPWTQIIMSSIENVLIACNKAVLIMIYRVANSVSLLIIIIFIEMLNWSFQEYMLIFVIVQSIFAISAYIIVRNVSGQLKFVLDKNLIKKILTFSIPIGLATVIGTLNIELDKLIIGKILDTEQLAIYTNASREMPVTIVASSLTAVLLPRLSRMLKNKEYKIAVELWGIATTLSYIIICFLATGFFVFAPDVMSFFYSEKYLSGVSVFRVYNVVLLLRCTYFGMILNAKGKTNYIFYSSIGSLGLNAILNYLMYLALGFVGPAVATFVSILLINLLQLVATSREINVPFRTIFPWKKLSYVTILNICLGVTFSYIKVLIPLDYILGSILESVLIGIAWCCLYIFLTHKEFCQLLNILRQY